MFSKVVSEILKDLKEVLEQVDEREVDKFVKALLDAKRIFIVGAGRSGLVGRAFAMRLMHLGIEVYVVGETITPAIRKGDLLIAISGSGRTSFPLVAAETSKRLGARVFAITSDRNSPLAKCSDYVLLVKGRSKDNAVRDYISRQLAGEHPPLTPLGTLFELSTSILLDAVIYKIISMLGISEREMLERHSNLE
ncbi:MAG: 6-phospho-3-hexuloisomerase [Thermoprotei archaeon]|nr:MAG: 6-phospho-3-hexuloisomerase [Thermoprotei archaeon]